jgi:hypothetical protein
MKLILEKMGKHWKIFLSVSIVQSLDRESANASCVGIAIELKARQSNQVEPSSNLR